MEITVTDTPMDDAPDTSPALPPTGDYDPEFPGSTPEAPFGYFANGNPRKRRPNKGSSVGASTGSRRTPATESSARTAAGLLARMNGIVAISMGALGLPLTAQSLAAANEQFEGMAYEALLTDPALCRKILSAGATSGKTGLIMAYGVLGASIAPAAFVEIKERRNDAESS